MRCDHYSWSNHHGTPRPGRVSIAPEAVSDARGMKIRSLFADSENKENPAISSSESGKVPSGATTDTTIAYQLSQMKTADAMVLKLAALTKAQRLAPKDLRRVHVVAIR